MIPEFDETMSANMVMMMRADVDGAIWLVDDEEEGRFYEGAAHKQSRVIPAFGAAPVILRIVLGRGAEGVLGVTRGQTEDTAGLPIYRPDLGDVASILLISRGADRVVGEVGGAAWLTATGREIGGILSRSVRMARGLERMLGRRRPTEDDLRQYIDWSRADLNWAFLTANGTTLGISEDGISAAAQMQSSDLMEQDLLGCDGMSAVEVLAAATRYYRPRGITAYRTVSSKELLSLLRMGFDLEDLENEGLYWRLKEWQWRNQRYALFRQWRKLEPFNILLDQKYLQHDLSHLATSGLQFAAIQLDLDGFKNVNDQLGHIEGDEAIKLAERILRDTIDGRGEAYRRGGDELAGMVVGISANEGARLAEQLREEIERQFESWAGVRSLHPSPTASIGLVCVRERCAPGEVVSRLEEAQMLAKTSGKNRVVTMHCPATNPPPE